MIFEINKLLKKIYYFWMKKQSKRPFFYGMELFYSAHFEGNKCYLEAEESAHCVKVLRHRCGDPVHIIDGQGTLYECILTGDNPREAVAEIVRSQAGWGSHPYNLTLGVCPTKNNDRFEWFVEKATEIGVDRIVPLIGERSERKVYKTERAERIALAATKQSLKAALPVIEQPVSVKDFIRSSGEGLKLIAYCFEGEQPRISVKEALAAGQKDITILIGPEGDFSPEEAQLAIENGYVPVHLGPSRLRTETAAVTAAEAVYFTFL